MIKEVNKLVSKKKWEEAITAYQNLADHMISEKNFIEGLKYLEEAIEIATHKVKKDELVITLYRKIISFARKGRNKTRKELFRYTASAIPLIENYIRILEDTNSYTTKNGAMTRYFLGECKEIVSGEAQRDIEFLKAGKLFVEVGIGLAQSSVSETAIEESFEKSRIIFSQINNIEEIFKSYLAEAEINIKKNRIERGFILFDQARNIFKDEIHQKQVINLEKKVYSDKALEILSDHFSDIEQRKISDLMISKAREAYIYSLPEFSKILFDIGRIYVKNSQLETAFNYLDEAITNSQTGPAEIAQKLPVEVLDYLFSNGKQAAEESLLSTKQDDFNRLESLVFLLYFDKINGLAKRLNKSQIIEEIAFYICQFGKDLVEKKKISDDLPYIEKAMSYLIENNLKSGVLKIGEELEARIENLALSMKIFPLENLRTLLLNSYKEIGEYESAAWLLIKGAKSYAQWRDYEKQLSILEEAFLLFQQLDLEVIKGFNQNILEQFNIIEKTGSELFVTQFIELLGRYYLHIQDEDKYDELYARLALNKIEENDFNKALEYHNIDFDFLVKAKKISRAMARLQTVSSKLFEKKNVNLALKLHSKEIQLLIDSNAPQEQILQTIKNLEEQINQALEVKIEIALINELFQNITQLYNHLNIIEGLGDAEFEHAIRLIEHSFYDEGFMFLKQACKRFINYNLIEKVGILLDYATERKDHFEATDIRLSGRFLDFLIDTLQKMNIIKEASNLMLTRAIQALQYDEIMAFQEFEKIHRSITQFGSIEDEMSLYLEFGSALLKNNFIEKGLHFLTEAKEKSSSQTNTLSLADICLEVADSKFNSADYDTYFTLMDYALEIYNNLEMIQEASTIAMSEARKFFLIDNIPYTMIFLEKALIPLTLMYDEALASSASPLILLSEEFIKELFDKKKFDEAIGFIDFQERIYQQLNQTDKIIEVERKKITALIGRGNFDGALSQVYDIATLGIEESKFNETIYLVRDLLPLFIQNAPSKAKDLLKLFLELIIRIEYPQKEINAVIDSFINLIIKSFIGKEKEKFNEQIELFFNAFFDLEANEEVFGYFTIRLGQEFFKLKEYSLLINTLVNYITSLEILRPETKMRVIDEVISLIQHHNLDIEIVKKGINLINTLGSGIGDQYGELLAGIFYKIGVNYKKKAEINELAVKYAFIYSEKTGNISASLTLLYGLIEEDFEDSNFLNALKRIDEVIDKLRLLNDPSTIARRFLDLIERTCSKLVEERKKNWLDLLTSKRQVIAETFLTEKSDYTKVDADYSESLIDDMLDFTQKHTGERGSK